MRRRRRRPRDERHSPTTTDDARAGNLAAGGAHATGHQGDESYSELSIICFVLSNNINLEQL